MINLKEYDVEKIFLTDFIGGHGGDFFITLFAGCNTDFIGHFDYDRLVKRLTEHPSTFPGNNFGKKMINTTVDEFENECSIDLEKFGKKTNKCVNVCTHPLTGPSDNIKFLKSVFGNMHIQRIRLVPFTFQSALWYVWFFENKKTNLSKEIMENRIDNILVEVSHHMQTSENDIVLDHIDITLNNPEALYDLCKNISSDNIDKNMFDYSLNTYLQGKVTEFKAWYETIQQQDYFEELKDTYQSKVSDNKKFRVTHGNR